MTTPAECPICKSPVIGRSDKQYCCDQCRAVANKRKKESEELIAATNKILRRNRNILRQLCPDQKTIVERAKLDVLGFNFHHFTAVLITQRMDIYYITYDYAFTPIRKLNIDMALVVKGPTLVKKLDPWKYLPPAAEKSSPY